MKYNVVSQINALAWSQKRSSIRIPLNLSMVNEVNNIYDVIMNFAFFTE